MGNNFVINQLSPEEYEQELYGIKYKFKSSNRRELRKAGFYPVDENNYFAFYSGEMKSAVHQLGIAQSTEDVKIAFEQFSSQFLTHTPFVPLFFRKESVIFEKSISGVSMPTMFSAFRNSENWYIARKKPVENVTE